MQSTEKDYIAHNGTHVKVRPDTGFVVASDGRLPNTVIASDNHVDALREYFTYCEPAPVTDLDVSLALNSYYDCERNWETWDEAQIEAMRRTLEQARLPASREEADTFRRLAEARERIKERLDRTYGSDSTPNQFRSRRDREAWRALSAFLFVDQRRREPGIVLSSAESDVLAWAIVTAFKVRGRR